MSQTVIFGIGSFIFALTVWGSVMAGGVFLGDILNTDTGRDDEPSDEDGDSGTEG